MAFLGVPFTVGGIEKQRVAVGEFADNSPVLLPVATVAGRKDGPTLYVQAAVHGDETTGVEIARRFLGEIHPDQLAGRVVVVPVSNLPAYLTRTRVWDLEERVGNDVWQLYPGWMDGLLSERVSHVLFNEFIRAADVTIDLHCALDGCDIIPFVYVLPDEGDGAYEKSLRIALNYGTPYLYRVDQTTTDRSKLPMSIRVMGRGYMPDLGSSVLVTVEMGESRRVSHEFVPIGVRGLHRTLQTLGMMPGEPERVTEPRGFSEVAPVHITRGGGLRLHADLGDPVEKGQVIGEVVDIFGDTVEQLVAPMSGFVFRVMKLANGATGSEAFWIAG
jgi:predicted deacylase